MDKANIKKKRKRSKADLDLEKTNKMKSIGMKLKNRSSPL